MAEKQYPADIWKAAGEYADELHEPDDYMHLESRKVIARAIVGERSRRQAEVFHVAKHVGAHG